MTAADAKIITERHSKRMQEVFGMIEKSAKCGIYELHTTNLSYTETDELANLGYKIEHY